MKKPILSMLGLLIAMLSIAQSATNSADQKKALDHMKKTRNELSTLVKGLSPEQFNFKSDSNSWSIAECVEHLAISEQNLIGMVEMGLSEAPDQYKRSEVALTDEQLLGLIESRNQKVKTRKEFEPTNSFGDFEGTIKAFVERRNTNMKFFKKTDKNLRNHYIQFPFGVIDALQGMLFISGHTRRHTNQIKEIMLDPDYPG